MIRIKVYTFNFFFVNTHVTLYSSEDVLKADAGECIICFEDMVTGIYIATSV